MVCLLPLALFPQPSPFVLRCERLRQPDFVQQMGGSQSASGEWALDAKTQALITSLLSAGTFFGALLQSLTTDSIGRKGSILLWSAIVSDDHTGAIYNWRSHSRKQTLMPVYHRCRYSSLNIQCRSARSGVSSIIAH